LYSSLSLPSQPKSELTTIQAGVQDELEEYVRTNVTIPGEAFLYRFSSAGGPRFPIAMANFINENFKPFIPVTKDNIITAGGVTSIEDMLAFNLADPGDGILVSAPIYGRFELDFGNEARLKIVYARMGDVDSFEEKVVERFEEAFEKAEKAGTRIRALLISNPSNPLGRFQAISCLKSC
jgi:aspartate/methionine/tyrosine aminotransferase